MMCLGMFLFGPNFFGTLWASWTSWKFISFARLGKFSFIICSNKFLNFLLLFFSFWHPYNLDIVMFQVVPEVFKSLFTFSNSCFFTLLDVYFFLLFKIVVLSPDFLPVTVGSLDILLYFTLDILHFFFFSSLFDQA